MILEEQQLSPALQEIMIGLSADWELEGSCHGYRKNESSDLEGRRIFLARQDTVVVGYLFGRMEQAERSSSIMPDGTPYFEVEELYVRPEYRSNGIGKRLFSLAEHAVSGQASFLMLSTATKNWRAILHFYLEEVGMDFWSARLFKRLPARDETEPDPTVTGSEEIIRQL